jgi:hypothetical protein
VEYSGRFLLGSKPERRSIRRGLLCTIGNLFHQSIVVLHALDIETVVPDMVGTYEHFGRKLRWAVMWHAGGEVASRNDSMALLRSHSGHWAIRDS